MRTHRRERYREHYARLLRLYPQRYRARFGEGMEQTFDDLCQEREAAGRQVFPLALWAFCDTFMGALRENLSSPTTHSMPKRILRVALITALILLLPLFGSLVSEEMGWTLFDFVFAGVALFGTGVVYELIAWKFHDPFYRAAIGLALGTALFLVVSGGAVGIIGSEDEPFNALYLWVPMVAVVGALVARFRPRGMSVALFAAATAQAAITAYALSIGMQHVPESSVMEIVNVNGFFILLWVVSAFLFREAAQRQTHAVS